MKKLLFVVLLFVGFCANASAQFFVSGSASFVYRNENFGMTILPGVGYEFNDRWAVGAGLGLTYFGEEAKGLTNPYVRFNCWNNKLVFVDLKGTTEISFGQGDANAFIGLRPSLRLAVNNHLQLSADMGLLGVDIDNDPATPAFGVGISGIDLTLIYRF
ncbi:MAG: hypothetical protein IJ209_00195 [Bacteroidaceae bacterium]|nr:hypothetical protein [Bacteroidaceae bacterium]